jgi:hypothetical protein
MTEPNDFACNDQGVFPDPSNCQRYYMCYRNGENMIKIEIECQNMSYSVETGDCSMPLDMSTCYQPKWSCEFGGKLQAWPGNSNIYYICHKVNGVLWPSLYRCPDYKIFYENDCNMRTFFGCKAPGLFPDMTDCTKYYLCDNSLKAKRLQCPSDSFFDKEKLYCVKGTCTQGEEDLRRLESSWLNED